MTLHTVKKGDTVYSTAKNYSVSAADIINVNMLKTPNRLSVGQSIMIPDDVHTFTVSGRDTVESLANSKGLTADEIWRANPQLHGNQILVSGQKIMLPDGNKDKQHIETNAFAYPYTDERVVRTTMPYLTYISILSHGITADGGMINPPADESRMVRIAEEYGKIPMLVLSSIGFDGMYSPALADSVIGNETARKRLTDELVKAVIKNRYGGAVIDFEYFSPELSNEYTSMVSEITDALHTAGKKSFVAVPPKTDGENDGEFYAAHDYAGLGAAADRVIIMLNELVGRYDEPQPISDKGKIDDVLEYAVKQVLPEKLDASFRSFGYDWSLPYERGNSTASAVPNSDAPLLAYQKNAEIMFDVESSSPWFAYYDKTEEPPVEHKVYFDDARTAGSLFDMIKEKGIGSVSLWTAGRMYPQFWGMLSSEFNIK